MAAAGQNGTLFGSAADLRDFQGGDTALHGLLQLLEGAQLDLADALARNAEFVRQLGMWWAGLLTSLREHVAARAP